MKYDIEFNCPGQESKERLQNENVYITNQIFSSYVSHFLRTRRRIISTDKMYGFTSSSVCISIFKLSFFEDLTYKRIIRPIVINSAIDINDKAVFKVSNARIESLDTIYMSNRRNNKFFVSIDREVFSNKNIPCVEIINASLDLAYLFFKENEIEIHHISNWR